MQQSLFDVHDYNNGRTRTGFRFQTLKLYNWGTFDNQVWRI
jgi:uncharacterized protein YPO0396